MAQLKPGVVSGKDYLTLVAAAKAGGYALPAVNVSSSSTVNAVLEAAAKNQADVIIQLSNGGAQFYAGQGMKDGFKAKVRTASRPRYWARCRRHSTFICWPSTTGSAWCCTPTTPTRV